MLDGIRGHFALVPDHRADNASYKLKDLLTISLLAACCGLDGFDEYEDFIAERAETLATLLPEDGRTPCAMTFGRVFAAMDRQGFKTAFRAATADIDRTIDRILACDGKTSRGSADPDTGSDPLHTVSVWGHETRMVLAQIAVDEKSNEIPALRELLSLFDLEGRIVVADAMHTQRETCGLIVGKGGDYLLPVKENQKTLLEDVVRFFADHADASSDTHETVDSDHGRLETRTATSLPWVGRLKSHAWPGLAGVGRIHRTVAKDGRTSRETAWFLMSKPWTAKQPNHIARAEWSIESLLHWRPDVLFEEDGSRVRKDNAAENLTVLRHLALNFLSKRVVPGNRRMTMRRRMRQALLNPSKMLDLVSGRAT